MIVANANWTAKLALQRKEALYYLEIVGYNSLFASFVASTIPGTAQGTVSVTNGITAVVWISGSKFTTGTVWNGKTITINGVNYTIASVTNSTHLVLTANYAGSTATTGYAIALPILYPPAGKTFLPYLQIPTGVGQTVNELDGHASISSFDVHCIDPHSELKVLSANTAVIGSVVKLWCGFAGNDISDFVTLHIGRVQAIWRAGEQTMVVTIGDFNLDLVDQIWLNGGPIAGGTVSVASNGTSVTWNSGVKFRTVPLSSWAGAKFWVNGLIYTIDHVTDQLNLVLAGSGTSVLPPPGSVVASVPYAVPARGKQGTVTVSHTTVTWVSGTQFETGSVWNGKQIIINGLSYTVSSVTNSTHLVLTADVGLQARVPYYTTGTDIAGDPSQAFPPFDPMIADNGYIISSSNPRTVAGNPMDILIAVLQNELGLGQADISGNPIPPLLVVNNQGGSGTGQAGYGVNPAWSFFVPGDDSTIITGLSDYVDVASIIVLRDTLFSGDLMFFNITGSTTGKSWIEDEILKPLGLYWVTRANGQLTLKSMKPPASVSPMSLSNRQIKGIPQIVRWPLINIVNTSALAQPEVSTAVPFCFANQDSLNSYQSPYVQAVSSKGLNPGFGAGMRLFSISARMFNRHAFATPEYEIDTLFTALPLELGDFISLTHPLLLDLKTGAIGVVNVLCEVTDRQPDYANAGFKIKVIDTRFINFVQPVRVAPPGTPNWSGSSPTQRATYMYIANASGENPDGSPANEVW